MYTGPERRTENRDRLTKVETVVEQMSISLRDLEDTVEKHIKEDQIKFEIISNTTTKFGIVIDRLERVVDKLDRNVDANSKFRLKAIYGVGGALIVINALWAILTHFGG